MEEMRILSPTAILGYGFPEESFREGMKKKPHIIAVDAGSTDPGPYYLGAGVSFTDRNAVKRDLAIMIPEGLKAGIPVIIGTAGGSGAKPQLCIDGKYYEVCQTCIHRVKFNRRSGCVVKGVEKTINCLDKACDSWAARDEWVKGREST